MQDDSPRPGHSDYLDFELEIDEGCGREYPVAVLRSPAGEVRATMHFPFDELALDLRLTKLQNALLRSGGRHRRVPSDEERAVQEFGQALFDALLGGEIRSCYDVSLREAARQDRGLRLKLRIRPPELSALPWEFMYDPRQAEYICLSRQTPIVRYLESPHLIRTLTVTPPLRILGMIASPNDLPALDAEREKERLKRATDDLRAQGLVELTWLSGQTWRDLEEATWGGPWHVIHFIGHGGFDAHTDEGFIALANNEGGTHRLSATLLGRLLADHAALRLVLLNSCEGARGSKRDIFSSTASVLVRRGIPAVLAMQYEITDLAAVELARAFYRALAYGMAVDEAVVVARKAISLTVTNTVEWGTPVLYMRAPDGRIFDVEQLSRDEQKGTQANVLHREARAAMADENWEVAIKKLQDLLILEPAHAEAASWLQRAQQQQELATLYAMAQKHYEAGRLQQAMAYLTRVQDVGGSYKNVDALIASVETSMAREETLQVPHAGASRTRRWPWVGIPVALMLLVIIFIIVLRDVTPPIVQVTHSPSDPTGADLITFTVAASDERSIARVVIAVDNQVVKECSVSRCVYVGGPYVDRSSIIYSASAWDGQGNQGRSGDHLLSLPVGPETTPTNTPVLPTDTPVATETPLPPRVTETPTASPLQAVRDYYALLNSQDYDKAWAMFTPHFQQNQPAKNINEYIAWAELVEEVILMNPWILEQTETEATVVITRLLYRMRDGTTREYENSQLYLRRETENHDWLIDGVETFD